MKYTAFGEIRDGATATDYRYTGQRDEFEIGLYYYVARYYDPVVGRFISADTIIPQPGSSQAYDRYAYTNNNPINFNDPSGHRACDEEDCLDYIKYGTKKNSKLTTVKSLLDGGYREPLALVRAYILAHPTYEPMRDPELIDDRPLLGEVARVKMLVDDPNNYQPSVVTKTSILRGVTAFTPAIMKGVDLNEAIFGNGIPGSIGFGVDVIFQLYRDNEMPNGPEKITRALIVGAEGASVQKASLAVMGGSGVIGSVSGIGDLAIMVSAYSITNIGLTIFYKNFNEQKLFPFLSERFK